ncbi:hypothetical protein NSU_1415 [Novosphingobium pentaromativorans US6-1]|uniref:Uncharacterized protein n=1 Tax=Novosphingobium pentaromativorans US6-1 TaxID=1088721 RepID=G6EAL7_9SPHN|nr:hypothetical protein NSU_1415 [Novosphingobium pentaromativorans US6-1]
MTPRSHGFGCQRTSVSRRLESASPNHLEIGGILPRMAARLRVIP